MIQQMGGHLKNSDLRNATRVGLREPAREEKNVGGQLKNQVNYLGVLDCGLGLINKLTSR